MKNSIAFNYSKLDGRITERFGTRGNFAEAMGYSKRTVSFKMNGKVDWTQPDIIKACSLLGIKKTEIPLYFFAEKV